MRNAAGQPQKSLFVPSDEAEVKLHPCPFGHTVPHQDPQPEWPVLALMSQTSITPLRGGGWGSLVSWLDPQAPCDG